MRHPLLFLVLCISCGGDTGDISRVNDPPETFHQISGIVEDSVLNLSIHGVRVLIGDSLAMSDSQGRFGTRHRSGRFRLTVEDYGYERYDVPMEIFRDGQPLSVRLQGQAPYLLSCTFETDLLTARIVDLQGRKTINRRSQSTITLIANQSRVQRDAYSWYWTPVDNLTWLAHVPHPGVLADTADWRLEDADGNVRSARCVQGTSPCTACSTRP